MKPTALIIDPSLRSADGHHLGVLDRLRTELAKSHLQSVSLASHNASEAFGREVQVTPVFERSVYYRSKWTREEFENCVEQFYSDLKSGLRKTRAKPDIVIVAGADQVTIAGLARYMERHRLRRAPEFLFLLMMAPNFGKPIDDPSVGPLFKEYEDAFAALRRVVGDDSRIHVCCETEGMTRAYAPHVGLPVDTIIVHKLIERPKSRHVRLAGEAIRIVCTGNANIAKGYSLLPEAIGALNAKRSDLDFFVHGTVEQTDYSGGKEVMKRIAAAGANVTVRTDVMSADDYLAWLAQADILLQPYDPVVYRTRGSGVFAEAARLGIPAVVTRGCDFAEAAIRDGRVVALEVFNVGSLVDAVMVAADHLEEITTRAALFAANCVTDKKLETLLSCMASAAEERIDWLDRVSRRLPWNTVPPNALAGR